MKKFIWFWIGILFLGCTAIVQPQEGNAAVIVFNGAAAGITGAGAVFSNGILTINRAGTYTLSGRLENGQVFVNAGRNDEVRLVLNNVSLHNEKGPAIYSPRSKELELALENGTSNSVSDGLNYIVSRVNEEPDAAIYVQNNLRISGSGTLNVRGSYKHGIRAQDFLVIENGVININAAGDAIRGRDGVLINSGNFTLIAGGDGIQSNNANNGDVGYVIINGGVFEIKSGNDGIQAESTLTINGGVFSITTGGGSSNKPKQATRSRSGWFGWQNPAPPAADDSVSIKGLKAGRQVNITGGSFTIDAEDDAVHSNGGVLISSGRLYIKTGDDAIHADHAVEITGGDIEIPVCYEGIEGLTVTISGGSISIIARDDAVNAAENDDDTEAAADPRGRGSYTLNENIFVRIAGGTLDLYSPTDGIDSNGNIFFEGGTVKISGPSMGMEGAIDLDGSMLVTGGELITAGSVIGVSQSSTQPVILVSYNSQQPAGSVIAIKDSNGNTLLEYTGKMPFLMSGFTSPSFKTGQIYSLYINGEKRTDIRVNSIVTSISDNGGAYNGRGRFR